MKKGDNRYKNGFTMLEVVLVLAIAGLIFLMIFLALPALQRTERDSERKEDIVRLLDNIKKYQTKNRGALPELPEGGSSIVVDWDAIKTSEPSKTSWAGFYKEYLGERFVNPLGNNYKLEVLKCDMTAVDGVCSTKVQTAMTTLNGDFDESNPIYVVAQAKCAGDMETGVVANSNARNVAVVVQLEGAGLYCASS